jgi:hypothetical protein
MTSEWTQVSRKKTRHSKNNYRWADNLQKQYHMIEGLKNKLLSEESKTILNKGYAFSGIKASDEEYPKEGLIIEYTFLPIGNFYNDVILFWRKKSVETAVPAQTITNLESKFSVLDVDE